jgi:hypothetical protein
LVSVPGADRRVRGHYRAAFAAFDMLKRPSYAIPLRTLQLITYPSPGRVLFLMHNSVYSYKSHWLRMVFPVDRESWYIISCPPPLFLAARIDYLFTNCSIELSLTVPIVNSLAFLFTVLGEWFAERKVISKGLLTL